MFDEHQRLRECTTLVQLLRHYAANEERDVWLDRVMSLDGLEAKNLAKLHGELIAHGWIEQNTGVAPIVQPGACLKCYRTTSAGRRALQRYQNQRDDEAVAA